jgi:protein TonB
MKPDAVDYEEVKRMTPALVIALALHGALIAGLSFIQPPRATPPERPSLNVSLLAQAGGEPPEETLAENTDLPGNTPSGAGNTATPQRPEPISDPLPPEPRQDEAGIGRTQPPTITSVEPKPAPAARAPVITTQASSSEASSDTTEPPEAVQETKSTVAPEPEPPRTGPSPPPPEASPITPPSPEMYPTESVSPLPSATELLSSGLQMARTESPPRPQASPARERYYDPRSMTTIEEFYIQAWIRKVERVGTLNFPDAARRRNLSGKLTLDVALNADGTVKGIRLVRSSGHEILDKAALRIVELAAPYAPFPPEMAHQYDILHIKRSWQFLQGNRLLGK